MSVDEKKEKTRGKGQGIGALLVIGALSLVFGVLLCLPTALSDGEKGVEAGGDSGEHGVAADVNGVSIMEDEVTDFIMRFRDSQGLTDDEAWGQWIFDSGYTMDSLRSETLDYFVNRELIRQAAEKEGLGVGEEEIDAEVAVLRGDATDEEVAADLEQRGMTEQEYRDEVAFGLVQLKLMEVVTEEPQVADETVLGYLKLYYPDEVSEEASSLDGVDPEKVAEMRTAIANNQRQQAFSDWLADYRMSADVLTQSMPAGLPYIVDLSPYEDAYYEELEKELASGEGSDDGSADAAASSDGAKQAGDDSSEGGE